MYEVYRKVKYRNRFLNGLYAAWVPLAKRLRIAWTRFNEKGHEHLTLMIVPNSTQKRIFTLKLSKFFLAFIALVIAVTVAFAVLAYADQETSDPELRKLRRAGEALAVQVERFELLAGKVLSGHRALDEQLDRLCGSARLPVLEDRDALPLSASEEERERYGIGYRPPEAVAELDMLAGRMRRNADQLGRLTRFVDGIRPYIRLAIFRNRAISIEPLLWPIPGGGTVTSPFGTRYNPYTGTTALHTGIDVSAARGTPIVSTAPGVVHQAYDDPNYGLNVVVRHGGGVMTRYAHLDHIDVFVGDLVYQGQIVGLLGNTGRSTGPHVHYEVLVGGQPVDPIDYMEIKRFNR